MFKLILFLGLIISAGSLEAREENAWRILLTKVPEQSLVSIGVEQNAIWLAKSIKALDKKLTIADDNSRITLYYNGKVIKSWHKPQNINDIESWTYLIGELLDLVLEKSEVAKKHDFEALDLIMNDYVKNLDKDSKYYSDANDVDKVIHRVNFAFQEEDGYLWIRLGVFDKNTKEDVIKVISQYPEIKGLILDLRASRGGQLSVAIEIADLFLEEGIVVSVMGRDEAKVTYFNSKDGDEFENIPLVILVDADTASAAEVLTIALQEQGRAKVIGTKTFGKGTIQSLIHLPNNGILAVSNANFYTPSGVKLAEKAIIPDICTFEMPESKDIMRLISLKKDEKCQAESRIDRDLEVKVAKELLKM